MPAPQTLPATAAALLALSAAAAPAAEIVRLTLANYASHAPRGKEVDALVGDYVLRSDTLVAVVANPVEGRAASLTVPDGGGVLIDLTARADDNDQLTAFLPLGGAFKFRKAEVLAGAGRRVALRVVAEPTDKSPLRAETDYVVEDGSPAVTVITRIAHTGAPTGKAGEGELVRLADRLRADTTFAFGGAGDSDFLWAYDRHWRAAYGLLAAPGERFHTDAKTVDQWTSRNGTLVFWTPADKQITREKGKPTKTETGEEIPPPDPTGYTLIKPRETVQRSRMIIPGAHLLAVRAAADRLRGARLHTAAITVTDKAGRPVTDADVEVYDADAVPADEKPADETFHKDGARFPNPGGARIDRNPAAAANAESLRPAKPLGEGRTDAAGRIAVSLPAGKYAVRLRSIGRPAMTVPLPLSADCSPDVTMENAASVRFEIVDDAGRPSPAKVRFQGVGLTRTPDFGPDSAIDSVRNLQYTAAGGFVRTIDPGVYDVLVSRGPEFDVVSRTVQVRPGRETLVRVKMRRTVDTTGWVSADLHNHSTVSGDNTADIRGRILNLIAEGVDFAPCTEHNRNHSYRPYLREMGWTGLLATSDGIELTGRPLPMNHQNAFPLRVVPLTQNEGGPTTETDPEKQIAKLAGWDGGSDKVVQINHPDIGWMFYDRNGDGRPDTGRPLMGRTAQVIEVWETDVLNGTAFLEKTSGGKRYVVNNRFFNWLQLLNQGVRLTAVANTDAHYNFHGSGYIRNWVRSSTDDPAEIDEAEMVRNFKAGKVVMSNGPFLEAEVRSAKAAAGPGDDLHLPGGEGTLRVRVQCANWLDVNRVQVLINGRPEPTLNYTRATHPEMFADGPVKFDWTVPLKLTADAHVIVVAIGEGLLVGPVNGDRDEPPLAVSNPVFVSLTGKPFAPNKDTLGKPLPVRAGQ
jgi:hypothetical protein